MFRWVPGLSYQVKLLFANNYYYPRGGCERVLLDEAEELQRRGIATTAFSRRHANSLCAKYEEYFPEAVEFNTVSGLGKVRAAGRIVYCRKTRRAFGQVLDAYQPDIVHGHNIYSGLTTSIIDAAKHRGVPFVLTLHDFKLICPAYLMLRNGTICEDCLGGRYYRAVLMRCHKASLAASIVVTSEAYFNRVFQKYDHVRAFLCPSRFLLKKHAAGGVPQARLVHLPNALDPHMYPPESNVGHYVLFAGRLSKEKGTLTLLAAVGRAGLPLRIAGMGPLEAECQKFAASENLSNVQFCGYCQNEKLAELYRNAAFIVVPSEWYENAPMSVLEAFAYGKPVLGSKLGGIPELVLDGVTGRLFEAGNVEDLTGKLLAMWNNRPKLRDMGQHARHRIETEFSMQKHADRLLEIYESLLQ